MSEVKYKEEWVRLRDLFKLVTTKENPGILDFERFLEGYYAAMKERFDINETEIKKTLWKLTQAWETSNGDDTKDRWCDVENYVLSIANMKNDEYKEFYSDKETGQVRESGIENT